MSTASELTQAAKDEFLRKNANLLALTRNGAADVFRRISASLALDEGAQGEVMFYADKEFLDQKNIHARAAARESFKHTMYVAICKAFLKVQRNYKIEFVSRLTPEALAELEVIEVAAGERPAPPPTPSVKSQDELLEEQIREDWKKLATDKLKAKMNRDPQYKQVFDRLMAANQLESVATAYTDEATGFRQ